MRRLMVLGLAAVVGMAAVTGCALFQTQEEETAQELIDIGMEAFENGKYREALEKFDKLTDWYPFSQYAIVAELKRADAHYHLKAYDEAILSYEEFERLHPRNEAIPHVIYHLGLCHFEQMRTVDRSQIHAREALVVFQRLLRDHPGSPFDSKAREHVHACQASLAGHDLEVGKFYFKSKHYRAALGRFTSVVTDYPDVGLHQEALRYIALCQERLGETAE